MKKRSLVVATLAVACLASSARAYDEKIVFVDMNTLFEKYYKTEKADRQLQEQADELNSKYEAMVENIEVMREEFNALRDAAQDGALSTEAREKKKADAESKLLEISDEEQKMRRFRETHGKQLSGQQRRMRETIVGEITEVLVDYARNQGYSSVIDSSGESLNGVPLILYSDGNRDITEKVLKELNAGKLPEEELADDTSEADDKE
ncbi:MAG: OmpH family outer membrane protein [Spartobacteria bacterium]|nr:OmpH family outer membrane protein [Spartobacteria bacterium]